MHRPGRNRETTTTSTSRNCDGRWYLSNRCIAACQRDNRAAGWRRAGERHYSGGWRPYRDCTWINTERCQRGDTHRKRRASRRTIHAEIVTIVEEATPLVVIVNVALLEPEAIVTLAGTCAAEGVIALKGTTTQPAGAVPVRVLEIIGVTRKAGSISAKTDPPERLRADKYHIRCYLSRGFLLSILIMMIIATIDCMSIV